MVKNFISAEEARTLTTNTQKPLNAIFKRVKEESVWGFTELNYDVMNFAPNVIAMIVDELEKAGYTVNKITGPFGEDNILELKITW